jgi:microcystin-dependent protein
MAVRTNAGFLVGQIVDFPLPPTSPPHGFLYCGNTSYLRTDYPALFAKIGTTHGALDSLHFNVPDRRGMFVRAQNNGSGNDPDIGIRNAQGPGGNSGDNVGSIQTDAMQGHRHSPLSPMSAYLGLTAVATDAGGTNTISSAATTGNPATDGVNGTPRTSSESRPKNVYTNYFIKY